MSYKDLEKNRASNRAYRLMDPERARARERAYRARNPEKQLAYNRTYRLRNPEKWRATQRAWYAKNPKKKRASQLSRLYGLSLAGYEAMLAAQGGTCAICGWRPSSGKGLCVDHDHVTGKVRELLCQPCNVSIAGDDAGILRRRAEYLDRHGAVPTPRKEHRAPAADGLSLLASS